MLTFACFRINRCAANSIKVMLIDFRHEYYSLIKFKIGLQQRTDLCKERNGNIVAVEQQELSIWAEYFKVFLDKYR
jgi:hypothetical protein